MKYILIFLAFISSLAIFCYFLLFTSSGNDFLKPYIQKQIQSKVKNEIKLESYTLRTNFIDVEILADNKSRVIVNGDFSIFDSNFNLNYITIANNLKSEYINLDGLFALKGKLKGDISNFNVTGEGEIFRAKTNFSAQIIDKKPKSITINSKGIQVEEVLAFVKQPIYTKGIVDIDTKIVPNEANELSGDGVINIQFGQLNAQVINKAHEINIPNNLTYRGDIKYTITNNVLNATSNIISNIARFETKSTVFDIKEEKLKSDFTLSIMNLATLKEIIGVDLFGSLKLEGDVEKTKDTLSANVNSKTLGGEISAELINEKASLHVKDIFVAELLKMLKLERYSTGLISANVEASDINAFNFTANLDVKDANLNAKVLSKILDKNVPNDIAYTTEIKAEGKDKKIDFTATLDSKLATLKVENAIFDTTDKSTRGDFSLDIENLEDLDFLLGQKVYAPFKTYGEFKKDTKLLVNGESDFLGAKTAYSLKDDVFSIKSDELLIQNVTKALQYPNVFESYSSLAADYNLTSQSGKFNVEAINGKLTSSELTNLVQLLTQFDMTQEVYKQSILKGLINKDDVNFALSMEGLNSHMKVENGNYNLASKDINSNFEVKIQNKDLKGSIKGNINNPKVKIDDSAYIKQKIDKAIDKNVPDEWKAPVKELLKLFG